MTELLNGFLSGSAAWGVLLTLAAFALGTLINKTTGKAIFNPLLLECLQDIQGRIQGEMKRAEEQPMLVQNSYVGKMIETVQ